MDSFLFVCSAFASVTWAVVLLLPWRPWLNDQTVEPGIPCEVDLSGLTVLIPARNEADVIGLTLGALAKQGLGLRVVVVDDGSDDGTADCARKVEGIDLTVIQGQPLPEGWSGKLWALEQGMKEIRSPWTLLLDADILLKPGMVAALLDKGNRESLQFVSIMASLRMESFFEKLLMPAFVYFFKLLYPFRLANSPGSFVAAAAGGCILLQTRLIGQIGGFAAIRGAIIDDCSLAKKVKKAGNRIWVGQSHSVISSRRYESLKPIWDMVARSAYTQLAYSVWLLLLCTIMLGTLFWVPLVALLWGGGQVSVWAAAAYAFMALSYLPTLRYYGKSGAWAAVLPVIAGLYLAMAWSSALGYWRGVRSQWKDRVYSVQD